MKLPRTAIRGLLAAGALVAACAVGSKQPDDSSCAAARVPADKTTSAPRPDESEATFSFAGNEPEQLEFVFAQVDGSYHYAERWSLGVPRRPDHQRAIGWDWKVDCHMHVCSRTDGKTCCHQICRDGGELGVGHEPPDAFTCMNSTSGGRFDWFIEGLHAGGIAGLEACGVFGSEPG